MSVFGFVSAQTNEKAAIDTIEVKNPHLFSKHEVYVDHSKNYNLYAAKYLHRSGYFRAAALVCTASAGVAWYMVERSDKPSYVAPLAFCGLAVVCEALSIHYEMKAGRMLAFSLGPDGAKVAVKF